MNERAWQELLDAFRALGGIADNVRLGDGAHGRGLFPVDPSRPVTIRIPENLLIATADVAFEDGKFRVAPASKAGAREKAFLEAYENQLSWGGGGRAETERTFEQAQALAPELRHALMREYHCGDWFDEPTDKRIQDRFIAARCIRYRDRNVVMPFVEISNHGRGATYATGDGVGLHGTFAGEVLVKYADFDPQGMFMVWGFATEQPQAFSIALGGKVGSRVIQIGRDLGNLSPASQVWVPAFTAEGGARLQFLMIGNRVFPRYCKGIFYKLMRDAGFSDVEEAFDTMRHANRMHFLDLLALIEDVEGPMANSLRRMAHHQLRAMSYCFGVHGF